MFIIACDFHPSFQQIAYVDSETGEAGERQLNHNGGEVEQFYRGLKQQRISVRVGMEATGNTSWFERLMMELDFELWIGDPVQIRRQRSLSRSAATSAFLRS
jgi:transposase